jgi:membrane protein
MNLMKDMIPLLKETGQEFQKDEAGQLGAALAYYAMFSIFPLLILLVSLLGQALKFWDPALTIQADILSTVQNNFGGDLRDIIAGMLTTVKQQADAATAISLVTLLIGASGVFQQLDVSFNKIWRVPEKPKTGGILASALSVVREKLFSFGMVLAVGFLLLISLALTGMTQLVLESTQRLPLIGQAVSPLFGIAIGPLVTLALNTLIFALLFKYLPATDVRWGDVWLGALVTALIWEAAKRLLALYIGHSSYASAYGAVGTVLVLMAWIYFSSQVLFLGAEFTEVYARRHGSRAAQATAPEAESEPAAPPLLPAPARAPQPSLTTGKVAAATSAGLLLGAIGGAIAAMAALIIGARRAAASVTRRVRRVVHYSSSQ